MGDLLIKLVANSGEEADLTSSPYSVLLGLDMAAPLRQVLTTRTVDSYRVRAAGAVLQERKMSIPVRIEVTGAQDASEVWEGVNDLLRVTEAISRGGGVLQYRALDTSVIVEIGISDAGATNLHSNELEVGNSQHVAISLTTDPFATAEPSTVVIDAAEGTWTTTNLANDWTFDASNASTITANSEYLTATANLAVERRAVYGRSLGTLQECQALVRGEFAGNSTDNKLGVVIMRTDANNYIEAYVDYTGATYRLRIDTVIAGVRANRYSTNVSLSIFPLWIVAWVEDGKVYAQLWNGTARPTPTGTATYESSPVVLADLGIDDEFGPESTPGRCGFVWTPGVSGGKIHEFGQQPWVYRKRTWPSVARLERHVPGTADAPIDLTYTRLAADSVESGVLVASWPRPQLHNMIRNGDFTLGYVLPWHKEIVAGVQSVAGTSVVFSASWPSAVVTLPNTVDSGASHPVYKHFKAGHRYRLDIDVYYGGVGPQLAARLGVSGDVATGSTVQVTNDVTLTVDWIPDADVWLAHAAIIRQATGGAHAPEIKRANLYEVRDATAEPATTRGGEGPGMYFAGEVVTSAGFTLTTDSTALGGRSLQQTSTPAAATHYAGWLLRNDLFTPDDYANGEVEVAIIARLKTYSPLLTLRAIASIDPLQGTGSRYTQFGSVGAPLTIADATGRWRLYYLGKVSIPAGPGSRAAIIRRSILKLAFTGGAAGNLWIDWAAAVPSHSMMFTQMVTDAGSAYRAFLGSNDAANQATRRIDREMRGFYAQHPSGLVLMESPTAGLLGPGVKLRASKPDEVAKGNELLVIPTSVPISYTGTDTTLESAKSYTPCVEITPYPTFHLGPDASG